MRRSKTISLAEAIKDYIKEMNLGENSVRSVSSTPGKKLLGRQSVHGHQKSILKIMFFMFI